MDYEMEEERSIASVMHDVVGNLGRIVRAEVQLAKVEVTATLHEAASAAGKAAKLLAMGLVLGQMALAFFLLFCVRMLETVVAPWLAALLVGAVGLVIALALLAAGVKQIKQVKLTPPTNLKLLTEKRV